MQCMNLDSAPSGAPPAEAELRCPLGVECELRVVNRWQRLVECSPAAPTLRCPDTLWFGGAFYCRTLWQIPARRP